MKKYNLYSYTDNKCITTELSKKQLVDTLKKQNEEGNPPYTFWITVYDPEIIDYDGLPVILEQPNAEEFLFDNFGTTDI